MNKSNENPCIEEILKDLKDLHSLEQFKEYGLTREQALAQLNAITQNIKTNFTEFIENQ